MPTRVIYLPPGNHLPHANGGQLDPGPSSVGSTRPPRCRTLLPPPVVHLPSTCGAAASTVSQQLSHSGDVTSPKLEKISGE
ncbi:hypothetical protein AMECASPLE_021147, partial [Ameca splendens]